MKELVGKGKPFYSALDKAAGVLKRKVGTGAEFMKELMSLPGVKQTEIAERGLGNVLNMPKITHEQFMSALGSKPAPAIKEKVLGKMTDSEFLHKANEVSEDTYGVPYGQLDHEKQSSIEGHIDEDTSHHRGLTLPGGENYREMLIKAPEAKDLFKGVSSHFGGERGILASMRLKDRTAPGYMGYALVNKRSGNKSQIFSTPEEAQAAMLSMPESMRPMLDVVQTRGADKKLLHLEELQSDWHQQGREHGYIDPNEIWNITKKMIRNEPLTQEENNNYVSSQYGGPKVPNAPFKKNWEEMALKRLIHHAAEKGYHGIVVTPGHEQADRYSLKHHVGQVYAKPTGNGKYDVTIDQKNGDGFYDTARTGPIDINEIQNLIGKELAEKIASQDKEHTYSGLDLEVGGEGMKGFYDKKVPNILNSIGKKYGVKTELHGHKLSNAPKNSMDVAHYPRGQEYISGQITWPEMVQANPEIANKFQTPLHHFPITEEMRQDVLTNGLPLYAEGGGVPEQHRARFDQVKSEAEARAKIHDEYAKQMSRLPLEQITPFHEWLNTRVQHKAEGGNVQPSINHMRMALMSNGRFPYTDLQNIGAEEAPSMGVKAYVNPDHNSQMSPGGVSMNNQQLPMGGIDMNTQQPGQQLMPPGQQPPAQQPGQQPGQQSPLSAGQTNPLQQSPSNILQMTRQGQAMNAMTPPKQMADGGEVEHMANGGYMTPEDHYHQLLIRHYMGDKLSKADNIALGLYHRVGGGKKLKKPISEYQFNVAPNPNVNMAPEKIITPEDLVGGHGIPFIGDSSMAGRIITGAEGHQFNQPVEVEGGHDYMRANALHADPSKRAIWASAPAKIKHLTQKAERLKTEGPVYGIHTGMSPTGVDFSHMPAEVLGEMVKKSKITKKSEKEFNKEMNARFKDFPGLMHEDLHEMLRAPGSGELRKHFVKRMATDKYQNAGFPEIAMARLAVQHPNLMQHDEPGKEYVGSSIGRFNRDYSLVENPVNPHHSYPAVIGGQYVGALHTEKDKPLLTTKDFFPEFHQLRREFNAPEGGDRRAFELAQPVQKFDQEWLDKVMPVYLARRKQLTGKKSGGKVKEAPNLDTMKLQLMRKPKKAK